MPSGPRSLLPHPDVAESALADGRALGRLRRKAAIFFVFMVLVVALPVTALFGPISAEWALAAGRARAVQATVVGTAPSDEFNRTCTMTRINVTWPAAAGTSAGHFSVCDSAAPEYPAGRVVEVAVKPGDSSVIAGESRAGAVSGVALESLVLLFIVVMLAATARWWFVLATAGHRWKTAPWLPGEATPATDRRRDTSQRIFVLFDRGSVPWPPERARGRTCLARSLPLPVARRADDRGLDPGAAAELTVQRRRDREQLEDGDRVWVAPAGRTWPRRHRSAPYAVIRASDRRVFWATGQKMPGSGW
jgi:hypothetical protein